ncbi:hypothetical protein LDENG_00026400 [Lucifuga dentata]|nr:hypothetical protein LDENG_00026400 [Lucifuga dentata]
MVPAEAADLWKVVSAQEESIQQHEQQLLRISAGVQEMAVSHGQILLSIQQHVAWVAQPAPIPPVAAPMPSPVTAPTSSFAPEPHLSPPERYDGHPGDCQAFLTMCSLTFELQSRTYASERSWVAFIISHLSGRAREWATTEWERQSLCVSMVSLFSWELQKVFDQTISGREAAQGLLHLRQGHQSILDYSIDFWTHAIDSQWNTHSLYYHGLLDIIKDELASRKLPADLDSLVSLTIRIDNRLTERKKEKAAFSAVSGCQRNHSVTQTAVLGPEAAADGDSRPSSPRPDFDEPMKVGRTRLSKEEHPTQPLSVLWGSRSSSAFLSFKRRDSPVAEGILILVLMVILWTQAWPNVWEFLHSP